MLDEQRLRHQHEARRAIAALERAALDKGLLHRVELARRGQVLDGDHIGAVEKDRESKAARDRLAVHQHGTAAAQALAAALARAEQGELRLQHFDHVMMRFYVGGNRLAVEREVYRARAHFIHPRAAGCSWRAARAALIPRSAATR